MIQKRPHVQDVFGVVNAQGPEVFDQTRGVADVARQDPEAQSGGDARLAELLRGIWLDPSLYETKGAPDADK